MRIRAHAVALFCTLPFAAASLGQDPAGLAPPREGYNFPERQTLTYAVDWRVFPAGTAVIRFESAADRERIVASAYTSGAINLIFHVADSFESDFDHEKGCSYDFDKQTVEGRRKVDSTLHIDYANSQTVLDQKNQVNGHTQHVVTPVHGCLTDLLSGIFYASSQPLVLGHNFVMPVADAQRTVMVTMKVEGREEIKTSLGTFKTLRVQPTADAGVVKNRGDIWIWYTDDDRHLPVQMRARLFWGTITFRLTGDEYK